MATTSEPVPQLTLVGLGPDGFERLSARARVVLEDDARRVIIRTLEHPAAAELAARREVISCDDLYESGADLEAVYAAIAARVMESAAQQPTVYAVPGSALVGERAAAEIRRRASTLGVSLEVVAGESFLDLLLIRVDVDPIADGLQIVDGRDLPDPFHFHLPTIITQVDRPLVLADVAAVLGRVLPDETPVTVAAALGSPEEVVETVALSQLATQPAGPRTTLYVGRQTVGWHGLVATNRRLRAECPWDREQTHHSLVPHLLEEAYETVEALSRLAPGAPREHLDFGAYAEVEEELGDLLLQVVFHATLAAEAGAFDVEDVAEGIRRKLVHRHPHVFGDVEASTPDQVKTNWEHLKAQEKDRESLMDDVPTALPAVARAEKLQRRAASVGFDWDAAEPVLDKVREELDELHEVLEDPEQAGRELGDLMFAVVNLSRHLKVDAELALRRAADTFADRFRTIEAIATAERGGLAGMSLDDMERLWERVKERSSDSRG